MSATLGLVCKKMQFGVRLFQMRVGAFVFLKLEWNLSVGTVKLYMYAIFNAFGFQFFKGGVF